jgi:hypothetical protein
MRLGKGWRPCSTEGRKKKCVYILGGQSHGQKPLEGRRSRWGDNIKMHLKEKGLKIKIRKSGRFLL